MFAMFWPFDFSCSGFAFTALLLMVWFLYATVNAASATVDAAKKAAGNETVQEVGKHIAVSWMTSFFKR